MRVVKWKPQTYLIFGAVVFFLILISIMRKTNRVEELSEDIRKSKGNLNGVTRDT